MVQKITKERWAIGETGRKAESMEKIKINADQFRSVFTLNTWTDDKKQEVRELLEAGYYVALASSAIGHTMGEIVEAAGVRWVREEYGEDVVECVHCSESFCFFYDTIVHLKKS